MSAASRVRAFAWFLIAAVYCVLAQVVASRAAHGLASADWFELAYRSILLFLSVLGFAVMGMIGQGQTEPLAAMGLARRPGWGREFALGAALGWGGIIACVLPVALAGDLVPLLSAGTHRVLFVLVDLAVLALGSLAEEVLFRGYPFQRLIESIGPFTATLTLAAIFGLLHGANPQSSTASLIATAAAGLLFALAYLRTRALWVGWGMHFAWNAGMGVLFGLPVSGLTTFSPVFSTYTRGPIWFTGGGYGPEGSALSIVVLLALMPVLVWVTSDIKHRYAAPVLVGAGIPIDLDAVARRQHEAAQGPAPAGAQLVQIAPAPAAVSSPPVAPTASSGPPQPLEQFQRPAVGSDD